MRPEHVLDLFLRADHGSHSVEQGLAFVKFLEDLVLGGDQVSDDLLEVGSTFGHLFFVSDQLSNLAFAEFQVTGEVCLDLVVDGSHESEGHG